MQFDFNNTRGRLNTMRSRRDPAKVRQCNRDPDRPVPAHIQITRIVEKNHSGRARGIGRIAEQRAHQGIGTPRLIDDSSAITIEIAPENLAAFAHGSAAQGRTAADHHARGFPRGMRIDDVNAFGHQYNYHCESKTQRKTVMPKMPWRGVIPAITTPFRQDLTVDHTFLAKHCKWLIENGCDGVVALGSLGEGATLSSAEKKQVLETCVQAIGDRASVVAGVSALSTAEAVSIARMAEAAGCNGLMVLPPYVYVGDWREMRAHISAVLDATPLSAMLYNNPIAYTVDFPPAHVVELMDANPTLDAIKESSADVRRIAALRVLAAGRLQILCGVDDLIVEAVDAGAVGWIAGLANAFPKESVDLFHFALQGEKEKAFQIYRWFLPLLHMDTVPKFVQLIKLVQESVGMGSARVRPPRLELIGRELDEARAVLKEALVNRERG